MLNPQGCGTIACNCAKNQRQRAAPFQVLRTARAGAMFLNAPIDIDSDSGVVARIVASDNVDAVRDRAIPLLYPRQDYIFK
jgi:hypothetical protein